jgi:DNA-3-methyladenine glycosylase
MRLGSDFYIRDVLEVAPDLIGKELVRIYSDGEIKRYMITEVEAYRGEEDMACHAAKGRTSRTEIMYHEGGCLYVYLIYGMYWMLNIVSSVKNVPQAVLIRGVEGISGPGKLTRKLQIDKSFNGESLTGSERIWVEDTGKNVEYITTPRINIDYAGETWAGKMWRFVKV